LPYADDDEFDALAEAEYAPEALNLSTTEAATVVNVTLVDEQLGGIARQNTTVAGFQEYPTGDIIQNAESLPYMYLRVNETGLGGSTFTVTVDNGTDTQEIQIDSGDVSGTVDCDFSGAKLLEIEFINGTGSISTDQTYCGALEFANLTSGVDVIFDNGDDARGELTITAIGSPGSDFDSDPSDGRWFEQGPNIIVNPIFEIEYLTPNVEYNATYAPYSRGAP